MMLGHVSVDSIQANDFATLRVMVYGLVDPRVRLE
jgi:hypothetical protein